MLGVNLRPAVARVWAPIGALPAADRGRPPTRSPWSARWGRWPSAVFLIGNGVLFWGAFAVTVFVLLDMLDGALARARGGGSVFGAVLDSTGDRAADAAIFAALAWWFSGAGRQPAAGAAVPDLPGAGRAHLLRQGPRRGRGPDLRRRLVERTERLILVLVGTGFTGLGIPYALQVACGCSLAGSAVTVGQRFARGPRSSPRPASRCRRRRPTP